MKKLLVMIMITSLLSLYIPQTAQAQYVDVPNALKEYGLDTVAYIAATITLKKITQKTVNWINSGFKGNPGYLSNPKQFFLDVGDGVASDFLSQAGLNQLCTPFRAQVRLALVKNYITDSDQNYTCTLDILRNNYNAFTSDFTQGGWDGWLKTTQNPQNKQYGYKLTAKNRLTLEVTGEQELFEKELDKSGGFLNLKRCPRGQEWVDPVSQVRRCLVEEVTVTPGTVINEQLTKTLGNSFERLGAADEINEVVTALVTQLVEQIAGKASGLFGASEIVAGSGSPRALVDQLGDEPQPPPVVNGPITATQPTLNCTSTGGSGGGGGSGSGGSGGSGGTGGTSNCRSTPGTVGGLPPWPFSGGSGGASCDPYTPNTSHDCTRVDSSVVLGILNGFRPSNNGMRLAEAAVQAVYPQARYLPHPVRLDKFDFGNGMVVDVIGGAIGNANGSEDEEGTGWVWNVECACNRNPAGHSSPTPPIPIPTVNSYLVTFNIVGPGSITDGTDTLTTNGLPPPPGGGAVTITQSKNYPQNSLQSITAIPAIGAVFVGWTDACISFGNNPTCQGNVTGSGIVTATFR